MKDFCFGCMEQIEMGTTICPYCGYDQSLPPKEAYHLAPGMILHGRYLIGRVIGYGGFGVTYLGYDFVLGYRVAIKEYLPSEFATRVPEQQTLSIYTGEAARQFEAGLRSFNDEAKRLAQFTNIPGVVRIYDVFHENKTAYIIMEYLEGESVADRLKREGKIPPREAIEIMGSVLATLDEVHVTGMIHRDVSPGNIFLTKDGQVKLLDFGAARFASAYHTKSLSIILKPGYAPEEQYRSRGDQGPWTDVYASGATLYKMLTGFTPQESVERMVKDDLKEPTKLGIDITKNEENALMNALNVNASERTQSAGEFCFELCGGNEVERKKEAKRKKDEGRLPPWLIAFICCIPVVLGLVLFMFMDHGTTDTSDDYTTVPNLINKNEESGKELLEEASLYMVVAGTVEVDFGESGLIQKFDPTSGSYIRKYETVEVYLSINETVFMPEVLYWNIETASERMAEAGLNTKIEYVETLDYAADTVISQEFEEGTPLAKNSLIELQVAAGSAIGEESVIIPDIKGMGIEQAIEKMRESGLYICIVEEEYSEYEIGTVLEQLNEGKNAKKGSVIAVKVSAGRAFVRVPDFFLKTKAEAEAMLAELGLNVKFEYEETNEYVEDLVIGQKTEAGTKLYEGDTVIIILSKYQTAKVPNVVGLSPKEAEKEMEKAGFKVVIASETVASADIAKGLVAKQSATGEYQVGKVITLTLSEGDTMKETEVPNVTGMSSSEAQKAIKNAGFNYAAQEAYNDTAPAGTVISYSPSGKQKPGTTITCVISKGKEIKDAPNVVGKDVSAAQNDLSAAGFTSSVSKVHNESVPYGQVIDQSVSGNNVTLTVSKGTAGKDVSADQIGNYPTDQYSVTSKTQHSYRQRGKETTQSPYRTLSGWNYGSEEVVSTRTETSSTAPATGSVIEGNYEVTRTISGATGNYVTYYWVDANGNTHNLGGGYSNIGDCMSSVIAAYGENVLDVYAENLTQEFSGSAPATISANGASWSLVSASYTVTVKQVIYNHWKWSENWSEWTQWSDSDNAPSGGDIEVEKRTQTIYHVVGK